MWYLQMFGIFLVVLLVIFAVVVAIYSALIFTPKLTTWLGKKETWSWVTAIDFQKWYGKIKIPYYYKEIKTWFEKKNEVANTDTDDTNENESNSYLWLPLGFVVLAITACTATWFFSDGFVVPLSIGLIVYFIKSFQTVDGTKHKAVLIFLGWVFNKTVKEGLVFAPWILSHLERVPKSVFQQELPDDPEKIWSATDVNGKEAPVPEKLPEGMKFPLRVTFNDNDPDENSDPLHLKRDSLQIVFFPGKKDNVNKDPLRQRITARATPVVRWRITSPKQFLTSFEGGSDEAKVLKGKSQIEDMVIAETVAVLSMGTLGRANANISGLSKLILNNVQSKVSDKSWGIEVIDVTLKPFGMSHVLNSTIQTISESQAKGLATLAEARDTVEAVKITAEGEKTKRTLEGEGSANALKAIAEAKKEELTKAGEGHANAVGAMLKRRNEDPLGFAVIRGFEATEKSLAQGTKVILDPTNMGGSILAVAEAMSRQSESVPPQPKTEPLAQGNKPEATQQKQQTPPKQEGKKKGDN